MWQQSTRMCQSQVAAGCGSQWLECLTSSRKCDGDDAVTRSSGRCLCLDVSCYVYWKSVELQTDGILTQSICTLSCLHFQNRLTTFSLLYEMVLWRIIDHLFIFHHCQHWYHQEWSQTDLTITHEKSIQWDVIWPCWDRDTKKEVSEIIGSTIILIDFVKVDAHYFLYVYFTWSENCWCLLVFKWLTECELSFAQKQQ